MILNAVEGKSLPVYGNGKNVRDWLYVEDHCDAIWLILKNGKLGDTYNIGGDCEKQNIEVVNRLCEILEELYPAENNKRVTKSVATGSHYEDLITYVKDRPGHDRRYAIDCSKIKEVLGWRRNHNFEDGLRKTVTWYLDHDEWVESVTSGDYMKWLERNYSLR